MKTPVVLAANYVYAFSSWYLIATVWGIVAGINGLGAIAQTGGPVFETLWPFAVGITSGILTAFTLVAGRTNDYTDTLPARLEKQVTLFWVAIVSILPVSAIYQWVIEGDSKLAPGSISTFLYLVFPTGRWIYLLLNAKRRRDDR